MYFTIMRKAVAGVKGVPLRARATQTWPAGVTRDLRPHLPGAEPTETPPEKTARLRKAEGLSAPHGTGG